ncbi:MAG: metallopeptidase family protein [Dehalococcoidia bacterium]|nr:metallopeptidase family protein [Dehalococcoidia bacterium]
MQRDRFRRLVQRAVRSIPPEVRRHLDNVELVIEREPTRAELEEAGIMCGAALFGLYVGTPLTERDSYGLTLPDRIVIFQGPLQRHFHPRDIPREVRTTVVHEIAHHFGIDDDDLHERGLG